MSIVIHESIKQKLQTFLINGKIPNIVFHGPHGSGKRTIVDWFLKNIYNNNKTALSSYVLFTNCSHGKGIRFVREELKFFAKTHINFESNNCFKTIVLSNADALTVDAQSALRRCIEQYSNTTRFFVLVTDKSRLLKPILSRFCEVFIPYPLIDGERCNLHNYTINKTFGRDNTNKKAVAWIKKNIVKIDKTNFVSIMSFATKMYEKGYCGQDLLEYIEGLTNISEERKSTLLISFHKVKKDFRNEKLFITFMINYLIIRSDDSLENVSFM